MRMTQASITQQRDGNPPCDLLNMSKFFNQQRSEKKMNTETDITVNCCSSPRVQYGTTVTEITPLCSALAFATSVNYWQLMESFPSMNYTLSLSLIPKHNPFFLCTNRYIHNTKITILATTANNARLIASSIPLLYSNYYNYHHYYADLNP